MTRKGDNTPERVLQTLIARIEAQPYTLDTARRNLRELLAQGPLQSAPEAIAELDRWSVEQFADIHGELLKFIGTLVRLRDGGSIAPARLWADGVRVTAAVVDGRVVRGVEGGARALCVLQVWELLSLVGVRNVRRCGAADCPHVFIKVHKRAFCSLRCQKRANKQKLRQLERERERERVEQRQRRRMKGRR